jgi:hypothetical protein
MPKKYNSEEERLAAHIINRKKAQLKYYYINKIEMNRKRAERNKSKRLQMKDII